MKIKLFEYNYKEKMEELHSNLEKINADKKKTTDFYKSILNETFVVVSIKNFISGFLKTSKIDMISASTDKTFENLFDYRLDCERKEDAAVIYAVVTKLKGEKICEETIQNNRLLAKGVIKLFEDCRNTFSIDGEASIMRYFDELIKQSTEGFVKKGAEYIETTINRKENTDKLFDNMKDYLLMEMGFAYADEVDRNTFIN